MKYNDTKKGVFISRPNRFEAIVELDGEIILCHVKNTGRCRELLVEGAEVILCPASNPQRKTKYDLIAVYKGERLINMDSSAPNKVVGEWLEKEWIFKDITLVKPESRYKNSRFDFYVETKSRKIFIEVKGVTLENEGVVMFPDAPTERGVKHVRELENAVAEGYEACVIFVVQMEDCRYFTPNYKTHSEFGKELESASELGVGLYALSCKVSEDELNVAGFVPIKLENEQDKNDMTGNKPSLCFNTSGTFGKNIK